MKELMLTGGPSLACEGFTELSPDDSALVCGGGYYAYPAYKFWTGFYDGFTKGFGDWVKNGFL